MNTQRPSTTSANAPKRCGCVLYSSDHPKIFGWGTPRPSIPPDQSVFWNTKLSIATAAPMVTIARFTPRTRSAGSPISTPTGTAISAAITIDGRNEMPFSSASFETANAPTPAKVISASEI